MQEKYKIEYVKIEDLIPASYNPRKWDLKQLSDLMESIKKYGIVDPGIVNCAPNRKNVIIGSHMRVAAAKQLGIKEFPIVYVNIPDIETEKELNLRLNKNTGSFSFELLAKFDESMLANIGFESEELDKIFEVDSEPEQFDINRELEKLKISKIEVKPGDVYILGENRLMCGDSTKKEDVLKLMNGEKADMVVTDPPYILDYLNAKRHGKPTDGFGAKKNRKYIGTDVLPPDFTTKWMSNVALVQKDDFSIIVFENWKNTMTIWNEIEKHWSLRNMIIWKIPNRNQGYAAKHKLFSKYDIALLGSSPDKRLNLEPEEELLQNEYDTALYATSGDAHWEGYKSGKKYCPTDVIESNAGDEKGTGQAIIFGTKPTEILIPYLKILTKRNDLIYEPFGGSGSTLIAANMLKRRCFAMEKCEIYTEVIRNRWEQFSGQKAKLLKGGL
jgi:DNA modification methylase